jgi:choice-of-anchor B domain-containing protein
LEEITMTQLLLRRVLPLLLIFLVGFAFAWQRAQAAIGAATPCVGGMAGLYPCENVDLLAFMPLDAIGGGGDIRANNVWGWTDPQTSKEYALQGLMDGVAFIDVTDPENPLYLGKLPTHTSASVYRDIKVYQDYAFIIADQPSLHGMQVFDLTELRDVITPTVTFTETVHYDGFANGHNLFINEDTGYAYVLRTEQCGGGLTMVDVSDPLNPTSAGCFNDDGLASDTFCAVYHGPDADHTGDEICVTASDDAVAISDVTDKTSPELVARFTYSNAERAHHGWMTADQRYYLLADMMDEHHHGGNTRIFIWDLADLETPVLHDTYFGPTTASDHNLWIRGDSAFVGNLRAGLRILNLNDIANGNLVQEGYFDTYPADDNPDHTNGAWAVYPYFESGTILVADIGQGLFIVRPTLEPTSVSLTGLDGTSAPAAIWLLPTLLLIVAVAWLLYHRLRPTPAAHS